MKYIKEYKENLDEPKVGDYVLVHMGLGDPGGVLRIGIITSLKDKSSKSIYKYNVSFLSSGDYMYFSKDEILYWSDNIEEIQIIKDAEKYNL
jgi:hypothetical protein